MEMSLSARYTYRVMQHWIQYKHLVGIVQSIDHELSGQVTAAIASWGVYRTIDRLGNYDNSFI